MQIKRWLYFFKYVHYRRIQVTYSLLLLTNIIAITYIKTNDSSILRNTRTLQSKLLNQVSTIPEILCKYRIRIPKYGVSEFNNFYYLFFSYFPQDTIAWSITIHISHTFMYPSAIVLVMLVMTIFSNVLHSLNFVSNFQNRHHPGVICLLLSKALISRVYRKAKNQIRISVRNKNAVTASSIHHPNIETQFSWNNDISSFTRLPIHQIWECAADDLLSSLIQYRHRQRGWCRNKYVGII